ncbi:MAG: hydroxyacylglutathione hydrolase [Methanomassiliicoccales archaeon PtaU1.Bin124]|nr:MAG: hydroxyacylglutathione hydrolase [Methanomassiliicoccales archaeon PtaU1.Bin124]
MPVHTLIGVGYDSNIFVVTGDEPIIVDAGTGMHTRKVLDKISTMAPGLAPKTIVLTHRHIDHVGGASEMAAKFGAKIDIHEADAHSVETGDLRSTAASTFGCALKPMAVNHLHDGDIISTGDHELKVLHTPGHTIGSMCLFEKESGILISGDTVFANGVGRWDLPTGNRSDIERSVKMLLSMKPKHLFPGHGEVVYDSASEAIKESLTMLGEF